jgi:broad specificity phosphatase PhoE
MPRVDEDFAEIDVGLASGLTWDEFAERFPREAANVESRRDGRIVDDMWPGGESISACRARCGRAVGRLRESVAEGTAVVVGHGGTIVWCLDALVGPSKDLWPPYHAANASISEVEVNGDGARLVRVGDVSHLGPPWDASARRRRAERDAERARRIVL